MNERTKQKDPFDLSQLLHPAGAFRHPMDVVNDPDLTMNEKRAILASWASDACAVEASPDLRKPASGPPISFDDIMDALKALDRLAPKKPDHLRLINRARRVRELYRGRTGGGGIFTH